MKQTLFILILFVVQISDAGSKKQVEKIVIHVPYKVHKHHHTHTKYKVITIPAPKKESTIIYYKPIEHQPEVKYVQPEVKYVQPEVKYVQPEVKYVHYPQYPPLHMEIKPQEQQMFIPPHQASAAQFLQGLHKPQLEVQKPMDMHESGVMHTPVVALPHEGFAHFVKYKPAMLPHIYPKPMIHGNEVIHIKLPYKPNFPEHTPHKIPFKPLPPSHKVITPHDSIPHASNQVIVTARPSKMMKSTSYAVKEPSQEGPMPQPFPPKFPKQVPFVKSTKTSQNFNSLNGNLIDSDSEYEHVGYLIIDGQKRKIVDKNFKEQVLLKR